MASDVCFTTFKEFSPLYYLLNAIPKKIQKGFRSILVHLTALDANKDYIAVGTSIGMLYLYCRRLKKMKKYNLEGKTETITVVKLLACFDDLVAIGTASGRVALFQLVSPLPGRNKQLRRFDIVGVHKNTITTLTWSTNGMKLFSGDDQGKVAYINVDLDQGACNSTVILEDSTPIVQLDYNQKVLLVSTYHRSLLIYTEQNIINQVGTQPRKSAGRFGACFLPGLCKQSALTLYSSRPGLRLWKSDIQGTVQSTLILKDVFANGVKPFELFPRLSSPTGSNVIIKPTNRNLGILKSFLHDGWLLSWNEESIYVVDSVNQALIGGLEGSSAIVSVSCTEDEIFVLTGDRDIIRISNRPEGWMARGMPGIVTHHYETGERCCSLTSEPRSRSSSVNSNVSTFSHITTPEQHVEGFPSATSTKTPGSSERFRSISMEEFDQQLIVISLKKKKKRKQGIFCSLFKKIISETLSESSECYLDERHTLLMRILSPDKIPNNQSKAFSQLHIDDDEHHSLVVTKTEDDTETFVYNADEETEKKHTQAQLSSSSDDEDIYGHGQPQSSSETSVTELHRSYCAEESLGTVFPDMAKPGQEELEHLKSDQFSESWMGYSGPGCGILSLVVSEKHIWCLDYKGVLYCSPVHSGSLRWQKFEDYVQQVSVSPSGILLWKIDQKSSKAFACGKVTMKGKRHWYEALPQAVYVALSDDTAWIIQTNGELYLQTGLSADRPCARAVKVDCSYPLVQITSRDNVVWALTEQRTVLFRHGISSLCPEGEQWLCDIVSERQMLEPVCIALGDQQTSWALDTNGNLWFRSGVTPNKPQGEDDHWWQVSITDYVVFDQCSIFQTIIHATQTVASVAQAPVERVADKLRGAFWSQQPPSHPSLLNVNSSGVWITSGKNEFHVAKGNLIGTYWKTVVPRGTVSAAKWAFVMASVAPTKKGSFLWLGQSNKDLFCINDQNSEFRPSTVQLPPDLEMVLISACPDAIWGLDSKGQIHIRTLSESCPSGMHWTKLDVTQLGNVKLASLTCGSQHVWACDVDGIVYFRVGTQPLNPSMMLPAWIAIEPPEQPLRTQLISIYSSPNDQMLWAIDNRGNVHVRIGITEAMPVGTDWEHVPGLQASQLAVSTRTVWVCCSNGNVARRYGITEKNPTGDYWKKIPGNVTCLTVTPQDELWAISPGGSLLQRLTKAFSHSNTLAKSSRSSLLCQSEDFDDEWEVI
uniref:Tectonin beta-propeller repeat containing 2 n=1 Tax=Callorhinchus milii TaxID=7868 RepID=A0A4W3IVS6_CALMI